MKELEVIRRLCEMGYLEKGMECEYMSRIERIKMPWCGVESGKCVCIKKNGGLYTQCENEKGEGGKCVKCAKSECKYGEVSERMRVGIMEYRDSEGNGPIAYSKIMKKLGLTKERVLQEGRILGIEVPEVHFMEEKGKRGRPRKGMELELELGVKEKKKRGRPRKEKEVENKITGEELIESLLREKENEKESGSVVKVENVEVGREEEEEETLVVKFEKDGVTYLKSGDNVLYDIKSHEAIGMWNEMKGEIEELEEEEEE
jgi:hypothetical protein